MIHAASLLFYQKGFDGTSVRDIAKHASVNVSLISYYFKGKQGLLEYAVTNYYETYIKLMEENLERNATLHLVDQLKKMVYTIVQYKLAHYQLTAFIERELSLDSTFVREMTVTYLAKENHLLKQLFYAVVQRKWKQQHTYFYIQLKGMLNAPFMLKDEWNYRLLDETAHQHFLDEFMKTIEIWLDVLVEEKVPIN